MHPNGWKCKEKPSAGMCSKWLDGAVRQPRATVAITTEAHHDGLRHMTKDVMVCA